MASATLEQLEHDVERARARFAQDLARLRDPNTMTAARNEMTDRALAYKDEVMSQARDGATTKAQGFVDDFKQRLTENPTAAVLIGTGIAWHLFKHPPITSLLVGTGLFALFRPDVVDSVSNRVAEQVQTRVTDATTSVQDHAADMTDRVSDLADQAGAKMAETLQPAVEAAYDLEDAVRARVEESPLLYSLAAVAVGAAIGVTAKRRSLKPR